MRRPRPRALPSRSGGGRRWFAGGLACGLVLAGWGWWSGFQAQRAADSAVAEVRADHGRLGARERLLTARQRTGLARAEVGRANFGLANQHLLGASDALAGVPAGAEGLDEEGLTALKQALAETRVSPGGDPAGDAARLARLEEAIDPLLPLLPLLP